MKHGGEMEKKEKKGKGRKKNPGKSMQGMPMRTMKAGKAKCAMEMGMGSKAK